MEYQIPEPSKNPVSALVVYYKVLKGVEYDDRSWDRVHFPRCLKSAKDLLAACKTFEISKRCLEQISTKFIEKDLDWTFETVVKHCHDWLIRRKGDKRDDAKIRTRFSDALTRQRTNRAFEIEGTLNGAQMVSSIGDFGLIQFESGPEKRSGDIGDGGAGRKVGEDPMEAQTA